MYQTRLLLFFMIFIFFKKINANIGKLQCNEEKCYLLVNQIGNWEEAKTTCEGLAEKYSMLAIIDSKEEQDFVEDYLFKKEQIIDNVWIGGRRENVSSEFM